MPYLTAAQVRAARAMLDWSLVGLAKAAGMSVSGIYRIEKADLPTASEVDRVSVRKALEKAGVRFSSGEREGLELPILHASRTDPGPSHP